MIFLNHNMREILQELKLGKEMRTGFKQRLDENLLVKSKTSISIVYIILHGICLHVYLSLGDLHMSEKNEYNRLSDIQR